MVRILDVEDVEKAAKALVARSILAYAIYELWGSGADYSSLHQDVRHRSESIWPRHCHGSFRFEVDSFQGSHSTAEHREIIESFSYTAFKGPIRMKQPDNQFVVFEDFDLDVRVPKKLHLGRFVAESGRKATAKYSLKKRKYIATTSMDAELSLVTANLALAGPGRLCYDPFMATGAFPLACAHFGATVFGSDLDGRTVRGKPGRNVRANFEQYDTSTLYLGGLVADLTNTPLRTDRCLDAILCDPPYGVREGLKVLGSAKPALKDEILLRDGTPAHLSDSYLPPKKPYSFTRMLDDVLDFSASMLVNDGRLCMWMPVAGVTAEDQEQGSTGETQTEFAVPAHPKLEVVSECTQHFNKCKKGAPVSRIQAYNLQGHGDCSHIAGCTVLPSTRRRFSRIEPLV